MGKNALSTTAIVHPAISVRTVSSALRQLWVAQLKAVMTQTPEFLGLSECIRRREEDTCSMVWKVERVRQIPRSLWLFRIFHCGTLAMREWAQNTAALKIMQLIFFSFHTNREESPCHVKLGLTVTSRQRRASNESSMSQ